MAKDNTLIHRAQTGDEEAFAALMCEHYPFVYTIVIRIVKNSHDAEEVVQDAFFNAYRGLTQLEGCIEIQKLVGGDCTKLWAKLAEKTTGRDRIY